MSEELFGFKEEKYSTVFYKKGFVETENGRESLVVPEEDKDCCAKAIHNLKSDRVRYFIKLGKDGTFGDPGSTDFARSRKGFYSWSKVTVDAFKLYAKFLRTGSRSCLHQAERER
jgi:hypothetical protein